MDVELKRMIENTMIEEYKVKQIRFKETKDTYKIFGLIGEKYKHLCTVDINGEIIEYKKLWCD